MISFFLNTRIGQSIILIVVTIAAVVITQKTLEARGYDKCVADVAIEQGKTNLKIYEGQNERDDASREISNKSDSAGAKVVNQADQQTATVKEKIHVIYRDPPATTAVAGCVHPVDQRVQDAIDDAVNRTNAAYR